VRQRMRALRIREEDLEESFVLGTGKGGQKVNKTASTVQIRHRPTGVTLKCGEGRSQHLNRIKARERLCEHFEEERRGQQQERQARRSRLRAKNRRPSPAQKSRNLARKRQRGEVKRLRGRPGRDD